MSEQSCHARSKTSTSTYRGPDICASIHSVADAMCTSGDDSDRRTRSSRCSRCSTKLSKRRTSTEEVSGRIPVTSSGASSTFLSRSMIQERCGNSTDRADLASKPVDAASAASVSASPETGDVNSSVLITNIPASRFELVSAVGASRFSQMSYAWPSASSRSNCGTASSSDACHSLRADRMLTS